MCVWSAWPSAGLLGFQIAVRLLRLPATATEIPYIFLESLCPAGAEPVPRDVSEQAVRSLMHPVVSTLALALLALPGFLGQLNGLPFLVLMFVAMYFILIAPNQRKQKAWQEMLSKLKAGDRVTTNGGIRGAIVSVKDDLIVIKTQPDGVKLEFVKSAIAAVTTDDASVKA